MERRDIIAFGPGSLCGTNNLVFLRLASGSALALTEQKTLCQSYVEKFQLPPPLVAVFAFVPGIPHRYRCGELGLRPATPIENRWFVAVPGEFAGWVYVRSRFILARFYSKRSHNVNK